MSSVVGFCYYEHCRPDCNHSGIDFKERSRRFFVKVSNYMRDIFSFKK